MSVEERLAAMEAAQEIILARLESLEEAKEGYDGPILPGIEESDPRLPEPVYQDPSIFYQNHFKLQEGSKVEFEDPKYGTIEVINVYGVKLLAWDSPMIEGIQYLGLGAAMASHRGKYKELFDAWFIPACGERWHYNFRRHPEQTGLSNYGTGVPHALPCKYRYWKKAY